MTTQLYILTAPTGKQYIGVTKKPISYRVNEHSHAETAIGRAIRKYGSKIMIRILAAGEEEYIYDLEYAAIETFKTMAPCGYNLREGGFGGRHTEESKRKIAKANRGKIVSEQTRKRIGAASRGRIPSQETRKKLSEALRRRHAMGQGFIPKQVHLSEDHKRKIGLGQKRRWARRQ